LSNSYFSAKPFKLREALDTGVKVGLGSDIAGGYELGINGAMRMSVIVSRMREGERLVSETPGDAVLSIDWKESLYLATKGGAIAMDLPKGCGEFQVGAPFDAQLGRYASFVCRRSLIIQKCNCTIPTEDLESER
jgi:guanine deaminase